MASTFRIDGIDKVINEINAKIKDMAKEISNKGFIRVGILLRNSMEHNAPGIPVDTGNLKASWFTVSKGYGGTVNSNGSGFDGTLPRVRPQHKLKQAAVVAKSKVVVQSSAKPLMIFGFAANYAVPVHELHKSKSKFFQKALEREKGRILEILAKSVKK